MVQATAYVRVEGMGWNRFSIVKITYPVRVYLNDIGLFHRPLQIDSVYNVANRLGPTPQA